MKIYYDENKRLVLDGEELTIEVVDDDVIATLEKINDGCPITITNLVFKTPPISEDKMGVGIDTAQCYIKLNREVKDEPEELYINT